MGVSQKDVPVQVRPTAVHFCLSVGYAIESAFCSSIHGLEHKFTNSAKFPALSPAISALNFPAICVGEEFPTVDKKAGSAPSQISVLFPVFACLLSLNHA